jgi:DNA-damage-inducible protein D
MSADTPDDHKGIAEQAFGEALERIQADKAGSSMESGSSIDSLLESFEESAREDDLGVQYWSARDLQPLLEYAEYRNFLKTVDKAKDSCANSGHLVGDHFVDVTEMVEIGSGAYREVDDIRMSRYACYLVAQNGDPRKRAIAFAQTYFAIQARRQELQDDEAGQCLPQTEDERRVLLRNEIKEHNKNLASAAKGAGVIKPLEFAIFQNFGYKGLYGGLDRPAIQRKKGLKSKQALLDHVGSTELAANLFRATQTEEKLRRDNVHGKDAANSTHYEVGRKVREAIKDIGGTMPENLPTAEDIGKVERRLKRALGAFDKKLK